MGLNANWVQLNFQLNFIKNLASNVHR